MSDAYQTLLNAKDPKDCRESDEGRCPDCKVPLGHRCDAEGGYGFGVYSICRSCNDVFDFVEQKDETLGERSAVSLFRDFLKFTREQGVHLYPHQVAMAKAILSYKTCHFYSGRASGRNFTKMAVKHYLDARFGGTELAETLEI